MPGWMGQWCDINASGHTTTFGTHLFFFFPPASPLFFFFFFPRGLGEEGTSMGEQEIWSPAGQTDPVLFPPPQQHTRFPPPPSLLRVSNKRLFQLCCSENYNFFSSECVGASRAEPLRPRWAWLSSLPHQSWTLASWLGSSGTVQPGLCRKRGCS